MISTQSRITQRKLDQALADIREYIGATKGWQRALNHLSSIKDYAMGEERFCTATQALEHCDLIKGMMPPTAPDTARNNLDSIAEEIRRIQQEEVVSDPLSLFFPIVLILGLAFVVYYLFSQ
jgi:hypothetical protein